MTSESSSLSQPSLTNKDEFELEVQEFDANALWELLSEVPGEVVNGGEAPMQAMEVVTEPNPNLLVGCYGCDGDINEDNIQDFDWLHIMEEPFTPCNDMGGWYGGACMDDMSEILEMGDYYSLSHSAIMSDEIGYIGLWQDN